jgi:hypothetical protein
MYKYPQEDCARALYRQLSRELASKLPGTAASVSGAGVHWSCEAVRELRSVDIHCFSDATSFSGAEFLAEFKEKAKATIWGRTRDPSEVVGAACAWLAGQSAQALFAQFGFVDRSRRGLESFARRAVTSQSKLAELTTQEMVHSQLSESCTLWFRTPNRSSEISYYNADNDVGSALFYWDGTLQFRVATANSVLLAALLERWLCDIAMPSTIEREFPSITMSPVARFYEQGRGVEGEFIESWSHVEDFYRRVERPFALQVLTFISELRGAGYERTLRAGQSLFSLLVSRSRRHGLSAGQPYIAFSFGGARFSGMTIAPGEMNVRAYLDGSEQRFVFSSIELTAQLDALLRQLEGKAID